MAECKRQILIQLDSDPQPSIFDGVVALDAGVDDVFRHGAITPDGVREMVHGAIFTRGPKQLKNTAIFVGGSSVPQGDAILKAVADTFFGPLRVSVMLDANGCNTTAAAAILVAQKHGKLQGATATVLAGTGPVGRRAARLLARQGAEVRVGSRNLARAQEVCEVVGKYCHDRVPTPVATSSPDQVAAALDGVQVVIAAGAAGVQLLDAKIRRAATHLRVAIDLNAVPPAGIEGIEATDSATDRDGVACYGAIGVGAEKMKIHKAAIRKLFNQNDAVLDAEEIYEIGANLQDTPTVTQQ